MRTCPFNAQIEDVRIASFEAVSVDGVVAGAARRPSKFECPPSNLVALPSDMAALPSKFECPPSIPSLSSPFSASRSVQRARF